MPDQPASMGDHLANAGPLPEIHYGGKALKVAYPVNAVLAKVELAVAQDAIAEAVALASISPGVQALTDKMLVMREHRTGGVLFNTAINSDEGQLLMLWACASSVAGQESFSRADTLAYFQSNEVEASLVMRLVVRSFLELAASRKPMSPGRQKELVEAAVAELGETPSTP